MAASSPITIFGRGRAGLRLIDLFDHRSARNSRCANCVRRALRQVGESAGREDVLLAAGLQLRACRREHREIAAPEREPSEPPATNSAVICVKRAPSCGAAWMMNSTPSAPGSGERIKVSGVCSRWSGLQAAAC